MTQLSKNNPRIFKLNSMKKFNLQVRNLLEIKDALASMAANPKIPISVIMNLNDIKQAVQPLLTSYGETKKELEKRMAIKTEDAEGTTIDVIDPDKVLEFGDQHKVLLDATHDLNLPTFTYEDLGYDPKKPNANKFDIAPGTFFGLGELVVRKTKPAAKKKD